MTRTPKARPEKLYASAIHWEGWTFHILSSAVGLRLVDLDGTPFASLADRLAARVVPDDEPNAEILSQLREYLRGTRRGFNLPLDLRGTPFQRSVWEAVAEIPYGTLQTYGDVARRIDHPSATRAVGQAVGANAVALVIPCHRVVGSSGALVGYRGGLPLKERLLALERGSLSL
ncbi:MAG: methylated-DNA--[protein]-cysteine S-methyltransferase [Candidatus Bipolaricaulota bacterium]|nr:methylated-DNA--[protein]-cysteine S-methyltransferase [Candidatus Bipolaricaulota bacterium]